MIIDINGVTFGYEDQGRGIPLLFIHGYPLSRQMWKPQIDGLSDNFRTIAIDLRGHGESQAVIAPYTMDMLADDCADLLDQIKIDQRVIVCGLSMGGYVNLAFYRRYPERVAGLILAATRAGSDSDEAKANRDKAAQTAHEKGASAIADAMLPKMFAPPTYTQKPELVNHLHAMMARTSVEGIVGALMAIKNRPDSTPMLPLLDVPTLILHGTDDQLIPFSEAQGMQSIIPGSNIEPIPGAGHVLNLEQPGLFNQAIRVFFGRG